MKNGFSLVELSIVLVILGLLTGGILAGKSLIRAAELRSVSTEYQRYVTAAHSFRDKYFALPGDIPNATAFWGKDNTNCSGDTGTAATPGTCNGNGGGTITTAGAAGATGEAFQFWKQLTLAGLLEGSYSGLAGSAGGAACVLGTNCPSSKLNAAGWGVSYLGNFAGDGAAYTYDYGNYFLIGGTPTTWLPNGYALKPEEAWNVDTKLDDGKPASGKIIAGYWNDTCAVADDGSSAMNDYAASYKLSDTTLRCMLFFVRQF